MTVPKYDPKTALDTAMAEANKYMIDKYYEQLIELEKLSIANDNQTLEIHKLKEHKKILDIEGLPSDIIENVSYEVGMKIAEQYKWYERKIAKLQEHIEEIYELIAGDNATNWPQDEIIDYIKVLNGQIAEWQDKEIEDEYERKIAKLEDAKISARLLEPIAPDEDDDEITEEEWSKQKGNYTTDEMNGEEITR
jgi:hypothetical protein